MYGVWPFEGRSWCGNEGYEVRGPVYGPVPVWTTRQIDYCIEKRAYYLKASALVPWSETDAGSSMNGFEEAEPSLRYRWVLQA